MSSDRFDAVILGGGPAGSSAAIRLAIAGKKVLLAEKAKFPREKLCGEFVSPECLNHLSVLGVLPEILQYKIPAIERTVFYSIQGSCLQISSTWLDGGDAPSLGISRALLDDLLLERARKVGVDVRTGTAVFRPLVANGKLTGIVLRSSGGGEYVVNSSIAIDATGRGRTLSRLFEDTKPKRAGLVAFKCHLRNTSIEKNTCELFSYPGGYGGCTEIEDGLFNLCFIADSERVRKIGNDPEKVVHSIVMRNERARKVLSDVIFVGDWLAVPIARFGRNSLSPFPGVFAVGDAAAFIDPFTGSGIVLALESAKIASDAIMRESEIEGIAKAYTRSFAATFDRRLTFCRILRLASTSPQLADLTIRAINKNVLLGKFFAAATRWSSSTQQRSNA